MPASTCSLSHTQSKSPLLTNICGISESFSDFNEMQALKVFIRHLVFSVTPDAWFIDVLTSFHWQLLDLRGSSSSEPVALLKLRDPVPWATGILP